MEIETDGLMPVTITLAFTPETLLAPSQDAASTDASVLAMESTCAVMIDVLRASSVMTTAGAAGVDRIYTTASVDQALAVAKELRTSVAGQGDGGQGVLLCGERNCERIDGFDHGNSPAEYTSESVSGKQMVMTTSNGTRAIEAVKHCDRLLIASFLNLSSVLQRLADETSILIMCAGTHREISREDVLLGGAIVERLLQSKSASDVVLNDQAMIAHAAWCQAGVSSNAQLADALTHSIGASNLIRLGMAADVRRCAELDSISGVVMRCNESDETCLPVSLDASLDPVSRFKFFS